MELALHPVSSSVQSLVGLLLGKVLSPAIEAKKSGHHEMFKSNG
jgi:hypothetical protein